MSKSKGFSVLIVFGEWGGFFIGDGRICLGWMAISYFEWDMETFLWKMIHKLETLENKG